MKADLYNKQINKEGFVIINKLIQPKDIKMLLGGFEDVIDYCISQISKKKFNNLDQKYLWLQKNNNKLKARGYDISRFHPSLYRVIFNKKLPQFALIYCKFSWFISLANLFYQNNIYFLVKIFLIFFHEIYNFIYIFFSEKLVNF